MRIVAITAFAFIAALANPAAARVNWIGHGIIISAPGAACQDDGVAVGQNFTVRLRPRGLTDNGPDSWLGFLNAPNAYYLRLVNRPIAAGAPYVATGLGSYGNYFSGSGQIVSYTQTPAALTPTTPTVDITVAISNWEGTTGCTATIQASFIRRR